MRDRIILVGQAPSKNGDASKPLEGRMAKKLAGFIKASPRKYLAAFERVNVLDYWPGKSGKGDKFPLDEARKRASEMAESFDGRRVVLLGRGVAKAFGAKLDYLAWGRLGPFEAAVFPHPSGINRWWNDQANVERASLFLRRCL